MDCSLFERLENDWNIRFLTLSNRFKSQSFQFFKKKFTNIETKLSLVKVIIFDFKVESHSVRRVFLVKARPRVLAVVFAQVSGKLHRLLKGHNLKVLVILLCPVRILLLASQLLKLFQGEVSD